MIRSILPLALRCLPKFGKATAFALSYYTIHNYTQILNSAQCFNISFKPTNKIGEILSHVIRV